MPVRHDPDQVIGHHGVSAADVQQDCGLLHQPEAPLIEHPGHAVRARQAESHYVHFGKQGIHAFRRHKLPDERRLVMHRPADAVTDRAERRCLPGVGRPDGAHAHGKHLRALEADDIRQQFPAFSVLHAQVFRHPLHRHQRCGQHVLRDGIPVGAIGVGQDNLIRKPAVTVRACAEQLYKAEPRHLPHKFRSDPSREELRLRQVFRLQVSGPLRCHHTAAGKAANAPETLLAVLSGYDQQWLHIFYSPG